MPTEAVAVDHPDYIARPPSWLTLQLLPGTTAAESPLDPVRFKTFPKQKAFPCLATAVVIEQHEEWQVARRYVSDVSMAELRRVIREKEAAAAAG